jgi:hypothetical protein
MAKEKFGVTVDEEIVQEVDELVAECDDLGAISNLQKIWVCSALVG